MQAFSRPREESTEPSRPGLPLSCAQSTPWRGGWGLDHAHYNPLIWWGLILIRWHEDCLANASRRGSIPGRVQVVDWLLGAGRGCGGSFLRQALKLIGCL